jgi:hypothetical protein
MKTRLGFVKLTALASLCAIGLGIAPLAQADSFRIGYQGGWHGHHHSRYGVSIALGSGFYGGRYEPGYYAPIYFAPGRSRVYSGDPYFDSGDYYRQRRWDGDRYDQDGWRDNRGFRGRWAGDRDDRDRWNDDGDNRSRWDGDRDDRGRWNNGDNRSRWDGDRDDRGRWNDRRGDHDRDWGRNRDWGHDNDNDNNRDRDHDGGRHHHW